MGGSPHPFSNSFQSPAIGSLRYNTAQAGSPIPIVYGTQRVSVNLLEFWGFKGSGGGKGGKGLGGSGGKKGGGQQQQYSVNVAFQICQGPVILTGASHGVGGNNRIWSNGGIAAGIGNVHMNFYQGTDGQAADPVFASSDVNQPVINYSGIAYATGTPLQLGSSPALPNISFEVTGFFAGTAGPAQPDDARPDNIVTDLLTNARYGAGFPLAHIGLTTLTDWGNYCQAAQLGTSLLMDRQQPAARWLEEIVQLTNSAIVFVGARLKIIPYGDSFLSNNGTTWTPNLTWLYDITDADIIPLEGDGRGVGAAGSSDPIVVTRSDPYAATNWLSLEYLDSNNNYNVNVVPSYDQGLIDVYGIRTEPSVQAHELTNSISAQVSADLTRLRKGYIRNTYKFQLGWRHVLVEPMDILLITDATLGVVRLPVRVTDIVETDNGELGITAEEIPNVGVVSGSTITPLGVNTAAPGGPQDSAGVGINTLVAPGNANPPIIFEPPSSLTAGQLQAWLVATGGPNWGGAQVWISSDNATYALAGNVLAGARQGVLTAPLAAGADPDTTNTLSVDLTQSRGTLISGTQADADNLVTLCYCDKELLSYRTATLTSLAHYNLTYLRRGAYGSSNTSHLTGSAFARFGLNDPSVFKYVYPSNMVGQTVFVKLVSFNTFGQALQDIAGVTANSYVLTGGGRQASTIQVSDSVVGQPAAGVQLQRFSFAQSTTFPAGLPGSVGRAGQVAAAPAQFTIRQNNTTIGTMNFATAAQSATFTFASAVVFAVGDVMTITAPNPQDSTLQNVSWAIVGSS